MYKPSFGVKEFPCSMFTTDYDISENNKDVINVFEDTVWERHVDGDRGRNRLEVVFKHGGRYWMMQWSYHQENSDINTFTDYPDGTVTAVEVEKKTYFKEVTEFVPMIWTWG